MGNIDSALHWFGIVMTHDSKKRAGENYEKVLGILVFLTAWVLMLIQRDAKKYQCRIIGKALVAQ